MHVIEYRVSSRGILGYLPADSSGGVITGTSHCGYTLTIVPPKKHLGARAGSLGLEDSGICRNSIDFLMQIAPVDHIAFCRK